MKESHGNLASISSVQNSVIVIQCHSLTTINLQPSKIHYLFLTVHLHLHAL